ncbi:MULTISPECIES: PQQ-binding-like beta-propeller repeat protein [unclassified Mucilaginibacter]|uniref:outer membrane protein assembly factor BamB family protein n=1 Tax=unclassified Mucilaginibacter TaxID=2617802 RepID=UPI0033967D30
MKKSDFSNNKFNLSLNNPLFKILFLALIFFGTSCKKDKTTPTHPHPDPDPVENYTVFFGSQNGLFYALKGTDGTLIWKYEELNADFTYGYPVYESGVIYATNIAYGLYAFDATTGAVKWKFPAAAKTLSGPTIANGIVYFGARDHYLYAVDAVTGTLKWKYRTPYNLDSSPTVSNGVVYIGSAAGILFAFDAIAGTKIWEYATGNAIIQAKPEVSNGVVFIGNRSGFVRAVDANTGILKWSFNANDNISLEYSTIIIHSGVLYFGSWHDPDDFNREGSLYAVKESDGSLIWTGLVGKGGFRQGPYLANGVLYASDGGNHLYAVNATTGEQIWDANTLVSDSTPTVAFGRIFIGSSDNGDAIGHFTAFDDANGSIIWQFPLPNTILTSKAIVLAEDGTTY